MLRKVLPLAVAVAAVGSLAVGGGAYAQPSAGRTKICHFNTGPRAGATVDFSNTPGINSAVVGSRCADMLGSNGVAVAPQALPERQTGAGRFYATPGAPIGMNKAGRSSQGWTRWCHFTSGPARGSTFNFAGVLGATPIQLGTACSDGSSRGVGVVGP
jgi:hypothetical protein